MVKEFELINDFNIMYRYPVYIYGAGGYGKDALKCMNYAGIPVQGFFDSNSELQGKKLQDIKIESIDELKKISEQKEIIIIIASISKSEQICQCLKEHEIRLDHVYTWFGLFFGLYFSVMGNKNNKIKPILRDLLEIWKYQKQQEMYYNQAGSVVTKIKAYIDEIENQQVLLVYQPGKVGSNSVEASMEEYNIPVVRLHGVLYPCEQEKRGIHKVFADYIKKKKKAKIITIFRDPIAKDIGHFFQKLDFYENDVAWIVNGIVEQDFQKSFMNYLSAIVPLEIWKKEKDFNNILSHIDYIGQKSPWGATWGWYDEEFKNNLGIDLLQENFDTEKGYSIIKKDNVEIMVLKMERMNYLENEIAVFLELPEFKMKKINQGKNKLYSFAYKEFYEQLHLPKEYVEFYFKNNPFTNHFYNEQQKTEMIEKWMKYVK